MRDDNKIPVGTAKTADANAIWEALRKPFPAESIGEMSRGGTKLKYVGHAAVTDRLNTVAGPENWNWEPAATDENGLPRLDSKGNLWIKLTVNGVTKLGYGDGSPSIKELIGDALRNAAMRFGVALDLWTKEELESGIYRPDKARDEAQPAQVKKPTIKQAIDKATGILSYKGFTDAAERKAVVLRIAGVTTPSELTTDKLDHVMQVLAATTGDELRGYLQSGEQTEDAA